MDLNNFVPQVLLEDKEYKVFLDLINQISTDIHDLIEEVPDLVDIENVPEIFLPKLSALVRYNIRSDLDINYQREIVKRLVEIYKSRGSSDEIIMAATYGDDDHWVGSHLFYPGADTNRDRATIIHPSDELFRHSKSKFSGADKYPGGSFYQDGTIIIKLSNINDKIRAAIKKVVPAGIRIYYYFNMESEKDGFLVDYGEWVVDSGIELYIELQDEQLTYKPAMRSHPSGARSSRYTFDGIRGYITSFLVDYLSIDPSHDDYPVELVGDKHIGDSIDYELLDLEIEIINDN